MNVNSVELDRSTAPCVTGAGRVKMITPSSLSNEDLPSDRKTELEKPAKVVAEKIEEKKKRRKKKWKKPKDKPSRPLSAYNLFFRSARATMLGDDAPTPAQESLKKRVHCKTHGKIGFADMARMIGRKWKTLDPEEKKVYEDQAKVLKQRYATELALWKEAQKDKAVEGESNGLDAMATAAMAFDPIGSDKSSCSSQSDAKPSDALRFMMTDGIHRRNMFRPQGLNYIRSLQDHHVDRAALLSLSNLDASLLNYPSAAEASANAILQHFQGGIQVGIQGGIQQAPASPRQTSQSQQFFDVDRLSQLAASYPANIAAMRRLQQGYIPGGFGLRI